MQINDKLKAVVAKTKEMGKVSSEVMREVLESKNAK